MALKAELEDIIRSINLEGKVELYVFRRGYEARNIDRLSGAIEQAHLNVFGEKPEPVVGPECSMWRDINIFNEVGIPAATYGPAVGAGTMGKLNIALDDLMNAARIYAMAALDVCNQEK
jgi:acetylornithine deacetylase/succinyl-diaminopimelate desuccinylase-like protein